MTRKFIIIMLLVALSCMFLSCTSNIFSWLYPGDGDDADDLIALGDAELRKSPPNPGKAYTYYQEAVKIAPRNGTARQRAARARLLMSNVDLILITSKMASGNDSDLASIITSFASALTGTMDDVIYYLSDVGEGKCDSSVAATDFEVNLNLMLAYFIRGFLKNGNSNGDDDFFSDSGSGGGDIFIFKDGELTYNEKVVDIEDLQSSIEDTVDNINDAIANQPATVASNDIHVLLQSSHNVIEDLLYVYKVFNSSFNDFTSAADAMNRGVQGIAGGEVVADLQKDVKEQVDDMNAYLEGAKGDANTLNTDHLKLVGIKLYGGTYDVFIANAWPAGSEWSDHTASPNFITYSGKTNLYGLLNNHPGDYAIPSADLGYLEEVINVMGEILIHIIESNLIKNLMQT